MKTSVYYSIRPSGMKYPRKWLLILVLVMAICVLNLCGGGCAPQQYIYEDELLESHNKMVDLQEELIEINEQLLDHSLDFLDKYNRERFDLESMDYDGLRSILAKMDGNIKTMTRLIQELKSETARFAGYCDILDGEKKQYAEELIENTRATNNYLEMAVADYDEYVFLSLEALNKYLHGYYDEGDNDITRANEYREQYEKHISLQNDYADKAYEADIKFMIAMGWEEDTKE